MLLNNLLNTYFTAGGDCAQNQGQKYKHKNLHVVGIRPKQNIQDSNFKSMLTDSHLPFQNDSPASRPALCPEWATSTGFLSSGFHLRWTLGGFQGRKEGEGRVFIPLTPL